MLPFEFWLNFTLISFQKLDFIMIFYHRRIFPFGLRFRPVYWFYQRVIIVETEAPTF